MVELKEKKRRSDLEEFLGVPVLVQLHTPLVMPSLHGERVKIPYAEDPDSAQWIPGETMNAKEFVAVQTIRYAVLRRLESDWESVEMNYILPGPLPNTFVQYATLISFKDIAYVTRVVFVPDLEPTRIIAP